MKIRRASNDGGESVLKQRNADFAEERGLHRVQNRSALRDRYDVFLYQQTGGICWWSAFRIHRRNPRLAVLLLRMFETNRERPWSQGELARTPHLYHPLRREHVEIALERLIVT